MTRNLSDLVLIGIIMKSIALTILFLATALPNICNAGGFATRICIENKSAITYFISGTEVDNFDWEDLHDDGAMNRPDHNWVNYKLDPGEVKCQPADINQYRPAKYFNFTLDTQTTKNVATTSMKISCNKDSWGDEGINCNKWLAKTEGSSSLDTPGRLSGHIHDGNGRERSECIHTHLIDGYQKYCSLFYINH